MGRRKDEQEPRRCVQEQNGTAVMVNALWLVSGRWPAFRHGPIARDISERKVCRAGETIGVTAEGELDFPLSYSTRLCTEPSI
jgi:hypothetical protein